MVNRERLARTFMDLVRIDSISRHEGRICRELETRLRALGLETFVDTAGGQVGADTGNLIGRFQGNTAAEPLLLSAHMDTVEPGRGIEPRLANGIFTSSGETILGADDKAGLSIILETLACIREQGLPCAPLEVVFSVCEEIGLQGAKHLDFDRLTARMGFVLDTRNPDVIVTRAPAANRIRLQIDGKAAHAGAEPEKGINAIAVAAQAIGHLALGRIDEETTCNLGIIEGGVATNIVPARVVVHGEVRSHDKGKLDAATQTIVNGFQQAVAQYGDAGNPCRPRLSVDVWSDFDRLSIADDHRVVKLACRAAADLGRKLYTATSGGGSDANIFARHGIMTGILGTGCEKVHTIEERVALADMVRACSLLAQIIRLHAADPAAAPGF
jgi:tripeptide aminopeptidase